MTRTRIISTVAATFIAAATAAPALAGGEAKNEGPFTRPVTVQQASAGEPKSSLSLPKTRRKQAAARKVTSSLI